MSHHFTLSDRAALGDLRVFLARAARVDDEAVRLVADGSVLAVYVAVLHPVGLLDSTPTVLGLRAVGLDQPAAFDLTVPTRPLLQRVEQLLDEVPDDAAPVAVAVPDATAVAGWAAISPPRGGWIALEPTRSDRLAEAARLGIDEVAAAVPTGTGEQIVHRVRSEVWGRDIPGLGHVPAGGAFAAVSLGFLGQAGAETTEVRVFESGRWLRLSTARGHVLVKRAAPGSPG